MPMVVDQEAKEREKQLKKEEEENRLTEQASEEGVSKGEINESKDRVYDHFKQVSQTITTDDQATSKRKKKPADLILGQMHGRKRKRESNITKSYKYEEKDSTSELSTPTPSLDTRIAQVPKKIKAEAREAIEDNEIQQSLAQVQDDNKPEVTSMR